MTAPARVTETHSAAVFFFGDRAYKVKKPVDLGFLDFRSRAAREAVCHHEVELNRRLAPDVYLGVADVLDPSGAPCDHLVVMRRLPDDRRLSRLVRDGRRLDDELRAVAHQMATLHGGSARTPAIDAAAGMGAMLARWTSNTDQLLDDCAQVLDPMEIAAVHGLAARYLDGRSALFDARVRDGRGVDGHGDLLADDIFCLDDGPRILDCIEFDDRLRFGDGLADVAFLAMDLHRLERPDLARRFLASYRELSGDTWPPSLAHHYIAYRAQVRAKVAALRAMQGQTAAADEARDLLTLSLDELEAGRVRLVLVGGAPGTGKSTVADALGDALGWTVLRSDVIRKELAGIPLDQPAPAAWAEGLYRPEVTERTYEVLRQRAGTALALGESVVLDASWTDAHQRAAARTCASTHVADVVELRCALDPEIAALRIRDRLAAGTDASDATPEIAAASRARSHPWPEATTLDTARTVIDTVGAAIGLVQRPVVRHSTAADRA